MKSNDPEEIKEAQQSQNTEDADANKKNDEYNLLSQKMEQANQEINNLKNQLLMQLADSENLRKRTVKQVEDASKFAINKFSKDLIEVLENLVLAINNAPAELNDQSNSYYPFYQGIEMTKQTLINVFAKHGIFRITPNIGDIFDHNIHEAVANITDPNFENNTIINVMNAGYVINDRLLKPAMVAVAKNTQS